jgi:hypothetical protein
MASKIEVDEIFNAGGDNDTGIDLATNDQILLKVANATRLTMNSTGQTTIVGEGGTTTTSLQQGLLKMWVQLNGTGTIATQDSFNASTLTDNGTGDYSVAIANDMANDDYSVSGGGNAAQFIFDPVPTTSGITMEISNSGGTQGDVTCVTASIAGDLA